MFQSAVIDKITSYNEVDLSLPGRQPCVYYCAISAQDSKYEFLSSLFFSCMFSKLSDYARRSGINGRLPVTVNFLLEEFCNIGKLVDFKRQLALLRGYSCYCQLVVQSIPMLKDRYEKDEWEEIISHCDVMIGLGVNDLKTAQYFSDKCGKVTIRVENRQMPLMPLFSPVYTSTRPYSQTNSNTQRALLLPDEIIRMDNTRCLVLIRGRKPLMLHKVKPTEFPAYGKLRHTRIVDHVPEWRRAAESESSHERTETIREVLPQTAETRNTPVFIDAAPIPRNTIAAEKSRQFSIPLSDEPPTPAKPSEFSYSVVREVPEQTTPSQGDYGKLKPIVEVTPDEIFSSENNNR